MITNRGLDVDGVLLCYRVYEGGLNGITIGYCWEPKVAMAMALKHLEDYKGGCQVIYVYNFNTKETDEYRYEVQCS